MILYLPHLAVRVLLRRKARAIITVVSIALGVAALTFLGGIMAGVNDAMIANSISLHTGNVMVRSDDAGALVAHWREEKALPPEVSVVLPRLSTAAMVVARAGEAASVRLVGVLPDREKAASAIPARIEKGRYLGDQASMLEVVVGDETARALGARPGDSLTIRLSNGESTSATVAGIFRTGIQQFDGGVIYAPLDRVKALALAQCKGEVSVFARRGVDSALLESRLRSLLLKGETLVSWEKLLPEVDQLTQLNVVSMYIVIFIVVIMLAAAVSNTTLVSVMDRFREFGVLKALGTTPGEILGLVLIETAVICTVAGAIGVAGGCVVTEISGKAGIDLGRFTSQNPHFVLSSVVYPRLTWNMAIVPAATVLVTGVIASLWPAVVAARARAARVLRAAA